MAIKQSPIGVLIYLQLTQNSYYIVNHKQTVKQTLQKKFV